MTGLRQCWTIRPDEACVSFSGRVSRFTPVVQARFTGVSGTVSPAGIDVEVDVRSLTTGNRAYDDVLSALDPFDVGRLDLVIDVTAVRSAALVGAV